MAQFSTGVTVVCAVYQSMDHAMTATAVASVSLDPPLVLVCVAKASRFHPAVIAAGSWAVSLLSAGQRDVARHFATSGRDLGTQFDQVRHARGPHSGAPVLAGALAWLDCETVAAHDAGDHTILVGALRWAREESSNRAPLTYYRGTYHDAS